jgi:hypothetical protein
MGREETGSFCLLAQRILITGRLPGRITEHGKGQLPHKVISLVFTTAGSKRIPVMQPLSFLSTLNKFQTVQCMSKLKRWKEREIQ